MAPESRRNKNASSPIVIREMELRDLAPVYTLGAELFTSELWPALYRTWDEYDLALMFASDTDTCLVAEADDERIVGFVLGTIIDKPATSWSYGYIVWIGVDATIGRRGVGRRLLDRLTQRFQEMGVRMLMVDTATDNEAAVSFFEDFGFGNRTEHVYLTKNLTPEAQKRGAAARERQARPRHGDKSGARVRRGTGAGVAATPRKPRKPRKR